MSDNTSTVKRPLHVTPDNKAMNETQGKPMNILEQFPNAIGTKKNADGTTTIEMAQPSNRAQRRAMEKRNKKIQAKQQKRIMDYIKKHPEAIKIELDENKLAEIEEQEHDYVGKRVEMNPIDEACDIDSVCNLECENSEKIIEEKVNEVNKFSFTPVTKANVIDVDYKEAKE